MSSEQQLFQDRAARDLLRQRFDARLMQVRHDLEVRSVPGRLADRASEEARSALDEAVAIADANKPVIAGTIAALALWFFRDTLLGSIAALFASEQDTTEEAGMEEQE